MRTPPLRCLYCGQEDQSQIFECTRGWLCHMCGNGWSFEQQEEEETVNGDGQDE